MRTKESQVNYEVLQMLNHIPIRDFIKIPPKTIRDLEDNISTENVNHNTFSREAYVLFLKIYLTYIANEQEKQKIAEMLKLNEKKKERIKQIKYNKNNIFKDTTREENEPKEIIIQEKKWYNIFFDRIRRLLKNNKE